MFLSLTDQNFASETSEGLVLVHFWAPWAGPCKVVNMFLVQIADELGDKVQVGIVDVEENQETARNFDVMSIPALFVLKDGKVVDQALWNNTYTTKETLVELVSKHF